MLALLALHIRSYLPFLSDDALISLRYARRFLEGRGLTWNDGERVEGYSNFLWVLATSLVGLLRIDLVLAARILGGIGMGAAVLAIFHRHRPLRERYSLPAIAGGMAIALSGTIAIWAIGGLEQPLLAGLLAWTIALLPGRACADRWRPLAVPSLLLGLIALTRPDGLLFTAGIALGLGAAYGRPGLRSAIRLGILPVVFVAVQEAFRLAYYGDPLPNPAYAKLAPGLARAASGAAYVAQGALWNLPLLLLGALGALVAGRDRARRARLAIAGVPAILWLIYLVAIGGDLFPGRRHFVPVVVLLAFLAAEGVDAIASWSRRGVRIGSYVGGAMLLGLLLMLQQMDPENRRAREERWEGDGALVGRMLAQAFGDRAPLLAVGAAGCLPYYSELPALDLFGLNDRYMAHHPPSDMGSGALGHELGDGAYVLDRKPDLIIFGRPYGSYRGLGRSGSQMEQDPRFRRDYRLVAWEVPGSTPVRSLIWIRLDSARIGIARTDRRVEVPGYLLCDNPASVARLDDRGRPGLGITEEVPAGLDGVALPPGRWKVAVEASGAEVEIFLQCAGRPSETLEGPSGIAIDLPQASTIEIALAPRGGAAHVRRVVCENEDAH